MDSWARLLDALRYDLSFVLAIGGAVVIASFALSRRALPRTRPALAPTPTTAAMATPLPLHRKIRTVQPLDGAVGPVTARAACSAVRRFLSPLDADFRLTFITAGDGLDHTGHSFYWDIFVELPAHEVRAVCSLQPASEHGDREDRALRIVFDFTPGLSRAADGGLMPALPADFVDSPRAVARLVDQGADFIHGDRNMTLATKLAERREPVWFTRCYGAELRTPFAEPRPSQDAPRHEARVADTLMP